MTKSNKRIMVITSVVALLPILIGLVLWNRLPDQIATHFGPGNVPDGWSSKPVAVFGLPIFLTAMHLFMVFVTLNDPKRRNIGGGMFNILVWVMPIMSLFMNTMTYMIAIGIKLDIDDAVSLMIGILFILMGNYMSKNHLNYTVGIRLPWTLSSEDNWEKTHRFASKLWVVGGFLLILNMFLGYEYLVFVVLFVISGIPAIYSYLLYKKQMSCREDR